jgi:hypothetical protein
VKFAEYVVGIVETRNEYRILMGNSEGKRTLGKSRAERIIIVIIVARVRVIRK